MMDPNKWVNTLPNSGEVIDKKKYELNPYRWIGTLPKESTPKKSTSNIFTKYTLITILFVVGLISVSIIKNATKDIQKDVDNLRASITLIKLNLHEATLDHEVITSPENISKLANENLDLQLYHYKKFQIKDLNSKDEKLSVLNDQKIINTKNKKLSKEIKLIVEKKINKKKDELKKLQEIYLKPEKLPEEIKSQVAKKIKKTKSDLKKLYTNPEGSINTGRVQKWAAVQVVKAFIGMPIIPGR